MSCSDAKDLCKQARNSCTRGTITEACLNAAVICGEAARICYDLGTNNNWGRCLRASEVCQRSYNLCQTAARTRNSSLCYKARELCRQGKDMCPG